MGRHSRILVSAVAVMITLLLMSCSSDCNYASRTFNSLCKKEEGSATKTKVHHAYPACHSSANVKLTLTCNFDATSSQLCNARSQGAGFVAILFRDDGTGAVTLSDGVTQLSNCEQMWLNFGALVAGDVAGIYFGDSGTTNANVTCTGASCVAAAPPSCFWGFDPTQASQTNNLPQVVTPGNYLACSFIDSYAIGAIVWSFTDRSTITCPVGDGGTCADQPQSPVADVSGAFTSVAVGANTTLNFTNWSDAP